MSKFKVCTFHIQFKENTNIFLEKIYNITNKINKKYCELNEYNYSFDLLDDSVLDNFLLDDYFTLSKNGRSYLYKYQYILDTLNNSKEDFIVFVEYDACFCNTNKKLEDYIDNEHSIFYSRCNWSYDIIDYYKRVQTMYNFLIEHKEQFLNYETSSDLFVSETYKNFLERINNVTFINEGFYIFKNDEISRKFLESVIKYSQIFYEASQAQTEGQIISKLTSLNCFYPHLKPLPPKTQGHIYGNSNHYNEDECLVCHNGMIDKNITYEFLLKIMENKYWKSILNNN